MSEMRPLKFQAFLRIMMGCDKFCTFCIVPSVRGPEQSRLPESIVGEARKLAAEGCIEITLLGQTVNSYKVRGSDGRIWRLADLLAAIHEIGGLERIKFITNFPRDMSDDLLHAVRDLKNVSPYLHVPAQHGSNDVLKRMKRGYTVEQYEDMLARTRETLPGATVSSDFVVGFCGETDVEHQRTCELVRRARFKNSFVFKYSARPGTRAYDSLPDDVPETVKKSRNNELLAIQNQISLEDNRQFVGQTVCVLVEGVSKSAAKRQDLPESADRTVDIASEPAGTPGERAIQLTGRTHDDRIVVFGGVPTLSGSFVQVRIDAVTPTTLVGSISR
jgi:tRNA-2-methylthio-N6-dimethylallyladenosine synthase